MIVIKKDGQKVDFDSLKVFRAVEAAANRVEKDNPEGNAKLARNIESIVINELIYDNEEDSIKSSEIQTTVEGLLMSFDQDVAIAYIEFRNKRDVEREGITNITKSVAQVIGKDKTVLNENANKDGNKFPVVRDLTAGSVAKSIGLKKMLPKRVANAHIKGDIHFHDLDYHPYAPLTNCCLINFKDMFENGFRIGNAEVGSPHSIQTAVAQTAQIIANVSSNQYGGCSFDRIDETLAPYAELNYKKHYDEALEIANNLIDDKDKQLEFAEDYAKKHTTKDIYDSIQSLEYEINTLYNSNGQTPFTSLGFGLGTNWFEREIQKAIFKNRMAGIGGGRIAIFPKLIFAIKEGLNRKPEDPNYDIKQLALECTSKCMYPDILNYDMVCKITGNFKVPMGCRSFLGEYGNELSGRMNLGVTTINLPRIAIQSNGKEKRFWKILDEKLSIIKEAMEFRIARIKEAQPINAPILYMDGAFGRLTKNEDVWELMKNGRASISLGYIGLYEVGTVFFGPDWETNPEAKEFTLSILKYMSEKTDEWSKEFDVKASVYGTPSESLTDRFCRLDFEKFGAIENVTDKEYYTNSFHYDTRKKVTPFEKIDFEKDYLPYTPGGFINYVELANARQNLKALEDVWDYSYDKIAYFAVNTPIDKCFKCGYKGEFTATDEGFECPECKNTDPELSDVVKRTCGYLGNPLARPMAHGRHKEIQSRVKHDV